MNDRTREERLLLDCVRRQRSPDVQARIRHAAAAGLDWNRVYQLAVEHGVWAHLLGAVQELELGAPDALRERLEQQLIETTAQNLARTAQLAALLGWLHADGVPAVAFKGPSLTAGETGGIGSRSSVDLDVLISPRAARQARAVLLERHYSLVDSGADSLESVFRPGRREDLFRPPGGDLAPVELQTTVSSWPLAVHLDTDELIARAGTVRVADVPIPSLCREDLLLALVIHGTRDIWSRLRLIADIDAAVRFDPNWAVVFERAGAARIERMLAVALLLAHDLLDTPVPGPALERTLRDRGATRLAAQLSERLFLFRRIPGGRLSKLRVWTRSHKRARDRIRCGLRLLCWGYVIGPWDRYRRGNHRARPDET